MRSQPFYYFKQLQGTDVLQEMLLYIPAIMALVVTLAAVIFVGWHYRTFLLDSVKYHAHFDGISSTLTLTAAVVGIATVTLLVVILILIATPSERNGNHTGGSRGGGIAPTDVSPTLTKTEAASPTIEPTQQTFFCTGQVNPNLDTNVSLRSGPSTGYPREDRIAPGVQVVMIGFSAPDADGFYWMQVTFNDQVLYVRSDFLIWKDCPALQGFTPRMVGTPAPSVEVTPEIVEPTALPNENEQSSNPDAPAPSASPTATPSAQPTATATEESTASPEPTVTQDPMPSPEATATDEVVLGVVIQIKHPSDGATIHPGESTRFEAEAFDARIGSANGTGIARVDFEIWAPNGQLVVSTDEFIVKYCANGGDDQCRKTDEIFNYEPGQFRIRAQATSHDGSTSGWVEHTFFVSDQAAETPEVSVEATPEVTAEATAESTQAAPEATAEATAESTEVISSLPDATPTAEATPEVTDAPVETGGIPVENLPPTPTPTAQPTKTVTVVPTPDVALPEATDPAPPTPEDAPAAEVTQAVEVENAQTPMITPTAQPVEPTPDPASAASPQPAEGEEPLSEPTESQPAAPEDGDEDEAAVPPAEEPIRPVNAPSGHPDEDPSPPITDAP